MSLTTPIAQEGDSKEDYRGDSSDAESDFDNDPVAQHARNSTEIAEHDRGLLDDEEEREMLLTGGRAQKDPLKGFFGRRQKDKEPSAIELNENKKRPGRAQRGKRGKKCNRKDEEGELLYEMEEGGETYDASSQASSSSAELDKLNLSHSSMSKVFQRSMAFWNQADGLTSTFAPTTILISLGGFRADFLTRDVTPTLNQLYVDLIERCVLQKSICLGYDRLLKRRWLGKRCSSRDRYWATFNIYVSANTACPVATMTRSPSECWRMISVANLVHTSSYRGKGRPVMPSNTELLPAD